MASASAAVQANGSAAGGAGGSAPGFLRTWWVAVRPFALPASAAPVLFGTVAAMTIGGSQPRFLLALVAFLAMALMHSGANVLNDAADYDAGLDVRVNPVSGAVVRGWITPGQAYRGAVVLLAAGSALGLFLVYKVGTELLWIGLAGLAIGVFYSVRPVWLKSRALGDLAVCVNFGILGSLGAWTVQTGHVSVWPAIWSIPIGLHVAAILHANNWRDIAFDASAGVKTMASKFGDRGSLGYYAALVLVPYLLVPAMCAAGVLGLGPRLPWLSSMVVLSLPEAFKLISIGKKRHQGPAEAFLALDGATARLNMIFGVLFTLGVGLGHWLGI